MPDHLTCSTGFWRCVRFGNVPALWLWHGCIHKGYSEFWVCLNMAQYASIMTEYALMSLDMSEYVLNVPEYAWINCSVLTMTGVSLCLTMLDIWQDFEYAPGIKYARVLNMPWYSYNNIIVTNVIILELLSTWFVHPGPQQLTILPFFEHELEHKNNES